MVKATATFDRDLAPTAWAPVAILGGVAWAAATLTEEFSPGAFYALACGGALSIWLLLVSLSELGRHRKLLSALLPAAGVSLLVLTQGGRWLIDATHHRPLGAVTFSVASLLVCAVSFAVCWRRTPPLLWGALLFACSFAWVGFVLVPFGAGLVEPLIGVGLVAASFAMKKVVRVKSRSLAMGCAASLASACLIAVWLAPAAAAHPFVLGLPGLFR